MIAVNRGWFGSFASRVVAILFLPSSSLRLFIAAACVVYVLNDVDECRGAENVGSDALNSTLYS